MKKVLFVIAISILLIASCTVKNQESISVKYIDDPHSYSQPNQAVITHLDLDIDVDFNQRIISGMASYKIDNKNSSEIILDSKNLDIMKVLANGKETEYSLGEHDEILGQALTISITNRTKNISIYYKTTDKTEALQWLDPQQTADKIHPFLFTQGEPIYTRTWIPIQDTPQVRLTYNATVRVPSELMSVMSAVNPKEKSETGEYDFIMPQAISPYLIALAVGDIDYRAVSNRTGIYAERSMIDKVHYEFSDLEEMLIVAEKLYGNYPWEQYDVIVLPPSFPMGGMENPRLTFATPTIIAGDKSLTSLIVHELAHSWSGNLVTNAGWDDFWLNEGFTVYSELRIMEALYGWERAEILAYLNRQLLGKTLEQFTETPDKTKLKLNLKGSNPKDGLTFIPYHKGYLFLRTLEEAVGREVFDVFINDYYQTHAFSTITTEQFIAHLNENLLEKNAIVFDTDEWIYQAGIPDNQATINKPDKLMQVEQELKHFIESNTVTKDVTTDWTTQEWIHFIGNLPKDIGNKHLVRFDKTFDFTNSTNSRIAMDWFEQAINHNYHGNNVDAKIEQFLMNIGRVWYVGTIYTAMKSNGRTEEALIIYNKARPSYHPVTVYYIDNLLGFQE
mgnify:FL=1